MFGKISIVIPTFNRIEQLSEVLDHLLASDTAGFDDIEILVVDDGGSEPALTTVESKEASWPFRLQCIEQSNSGPAAARNNGFRRAANEIVLFVDDDVLVPPDLLGGHVEAHTRNPNSVVFGLYPYVEPSISTPAYRYLDKLERDARSEVAMSGGEYIHSRILASGNLSVERSTFADLGGVYDETLKTPMAEEIELALRLERLGIPIIYVPALDALHTQPTTIDGKCRQDLKYGLGIAEAYSKLRDHAPQEQFAATIKVNGPIRSSDSLALKAAKVVKSVLAVSPIRRAFLSVVQVVERLFPHNDKLLFALYRKVIGVHYFAGIREGLSKFNKI